jgi:uncharacterized membrane protein
MKLLYFALGAATSYSVIVGEWGLAVLAFLATILLWIMDLISLKKNGSNTKNGEPKNT